MPDSKTRLRDLVSGTFGTLNQQDWVESGIRSRPSVVAGDLETSRTRQKGWHEKDVFQSNTSVGLTFYTALDSLKTIHRDESQDTGDSPTAVALVSPLIT